MNNVIDLKEARRIKELENNYEWLFGEVIPCIYKYGIYITDELLDKLLADPDSIPEFFMNYKKSIENDRKLKEGS